MTAPAPLAQALADGPRRSYDRGFTWSYADEAVPPDRGGFGSPPVEWDGLPLNTGDQLNGLCAVVENIEGWLDSPPLDGHDAIRSIADGAAWGPKTLGPRTVVISGAATGPRPLLLAFRDGLGARAAAKDPAELVVGSLAADVRAGTEHLRVTWLTSVFFRYQVTVTAADPVLYDYRWQTLTLFNESGGVTTGRPYPRAFPWRYASSVVPNTGTLANAGNTAAPVYALYEGDLTESRLVGQEGQSIRLAPVADQMQVLVATATLTASAVGGLSRASFILPGSRAMTLAAGSSGRWFLFSAGFGSVTLAWRSAWV